MRSAGDEDASFEWFWDALCAQVLLVSIAWSVCSHLPSEALRRYGIGAHELVHLTCVVRSGSQTKAHSAQDLQQQT